VPNRFSGVGLSGDILISAGGGGYTPKFTPAARVKNSTVWLKQPSNNMFIELKGVHTLTLSQPVEVLEYQTDPGFRISDHLALKAPVFSMDVTLGDIWEGGENPNTIQEDRASKLTDLRKLYNSREPFIIECDFGTYESMVFTEFDIEESEKSANTFNVSIAIKKIIKAVILVSKIQFIYDEANQTLVGTDVDTGGLVEIQLTSFTAVSDADRSIIEKMYAAITGVGG